MGHAKTREYSDAPAASEALLLLEQDLEDDVLDVVRFRVSGIETEIPLSQAPDASFVARVLGVQNLVDQRSPSPTLHVGAGDVAAVSR